MTCLVERAAAKLGPAMNPANSARLCFGLFSCSSFRENLFLTCFHFEVANSSALSSCSCESPLSLSSVGLDPSYIG